MNSTPAQLVIALDNCTVSEAKDLVRELSEAGVSWFKVGLELYTQAGPSFVTDLKREGLKVFLDLKLYDIPNTVAKAVRAAAATGADLLTVHCSGGRAMLAAAQGETKGTSLSLLGVTVLTSFQPHDFAEVAEAWGAKHGMPIPRGAVSHRLAELAADCGLPGMVSSVSDLRDGELGKLAWKIKQPFFITPGIRNSSSAKDDQSSIATAEQAIIAGSTHLVVGRPVTAPATGTRAAAAQAFLKEMKESYGNANHS